ncbi:MAG TPA: GNAT family N-acetyltransferase [Aurantimonas sp.]
MNIAASRIDSRPSIDGGRSNHPPTQSEVRVGLETDFDYCSAEFRGLYESSGATAFQHPVWLKVFYSILVPGRNARALTLVGRDVNGGRLRFVLPLVERRKLAVRLVETADLGVGDYACPIVDRHWHLPQGLADLVAAALPRHDVLRIRPIREEAVNDWTVFISAPAARTDFSAHATALLPSYPDWRVNALSKGFTRYLDRKKRRLLKSGRVELRRLDEPAALREAIGRMKTLRAGRFEGDPIQTEAVERFYKEIAVGGADAGLAQTYVLSIDDQSVGCVFGLTRKGRFHYLLIGCDYDRFGRHSPGLVMYDMIIERWIQEGGESFDFTIGDEPFKADFGAVPTAMYEIEKAGTAVGRLALAAFRLRRRLRARGTAKEGRQNR